MRNSPPSRTYVLILVGADISRQKCRDRSRAEEHRRMDSEGRYLALPIVLQNVACTAQGFRLNRDRYGGAYPKIEQAALRRIGMTQERIEDFRNRRLSAFIQRAYADVPFY